MTKSIYGPTLRPTFQVRRFTVARTSMTSHGKTAGVLLIFFAIVVVVVGLFILPSVPAPGDQYPTWGWFLTVGIAVALGLPGVLLLARGLRADRIYKIGLPGEATVISNEQAAFGIGSSDSNDYRVTPIYKLVLRVSLPGEAPYEAKVNEIAPGMRRYQMQPGATLPVRVDPKRRSRVVVDWERQAPVAVAGLVPGAMGLAGLGIPVQTGPTLPVVSYTGTESPESVRATVRQIGLVGTASISSVVPAGTGADGRQNYVLGLSIDVGGGVPMRVDNAPAAVEPRYAHKVAVGATVPVRVAQVGAAQATVLLWDEA
jgi:Protein of unknown function (DUF3592)